MKVNLKQKLDELHSQGKEIKVTWEGGNDSGGLTVYVDGKELKYMDPLGDAIIDVVGNEIDYGSWAGDFYADGEVCYDSSDSCFIGEGRDSTTEQDSFDTDFQIRIPKALNFDRITIDTEGGPMYDDLTCQFKLFVTNGPVFEEHVNLEEFWEKKIVEEFLEYAKIRDLAEEEDNHVQSMYNDWVINREEMEEVGDDLVYTIDNVSYSYENAMHRDRTVHIDESSYYEDGSIESNPPK